MDSQRPQGTFQRRADDPTNPPVTTQQPGGQNYSSHTRPLSASRVPVGSQAPQPGQPQAGPGPLPFGHPFSSTGLHYDYSQIQQTLSRPAVDPSVPAHTTQTPFVPQASSASRARAGSFPSPAIPPPNQQAPASRPHALPQQPYRPSSEGQPSAASAPPASSGGLATESPSVRNVMNNQIHQISSRIMAPAKPLIQQAFLAAAEGVAREIGDAYATVAQSLDIERNRTQKIYADCQRLQSERDDARKQFRALMHEIEMLKERNNDLVQENVKVQQEKAYLLSQLANITKPATANPNSPIDSGSERHERQSEPELDVSRVDSANNLPSLPRQMLEAIGASEAFKLNLERCMGHFISELEAEKKAREQAERGLAETREQLNSLSDQQHKRTVPVQHPSISSVSSTAALPSNLMRSDSERDVDTKPSDPLATGTPNETPTPSTVDDLQIIDLTLQDPSPTTFQPARNVLVPNETSFARSIAQSQSITSGTTTSIRSLVAEKTEVARPLKRRRVSSDNSEKEEGEIKGDGTPEVGEIREHARDEERQVKGEICEGESYNIAPPVNAPASGSTATEQLAGPEPRKPPQLTHRRLSIGDINLLYQRSADTITCRICLTQRAQMKKKGSSLGMSVAVVRFPPDAPWKDIAGHIENAHPSECEVFLSKSPAAIAEMRQRLQKSPPG